MTANIFFHQFICSQKSQNKESTEPIIYAEKNNAYAHAFHHRQQSASHKKDCMCEKEKEWKKNVDLMIENEFRHEKCKESQTWIFIYMKSLKAKTISRWKKIKKAASYIMQTGKD